MEATMRTMLLATIWALGLVVATMVLPAATSIVGHASSIGAAGSATAAAYSLADVLEPGTRGSVVDI
jgi:hypothetical protein